MSDVPHEHGCTEYAPHLAELALGILTGRPRAVTLAHVESCPRCADELEQLSRAADSVVLVAPEMEPPMGFEVRLFSEMGLADTPARRSFAPRWVLATAAAVVALAVGLGIGLSTGSSPHAHNSLAIGSAPGDKLISETALIQDGKRVGHVFLYGGATPWMYMTLDDSAVHGHVTCRVVTLTGVTRNVGSFTASNGYGAWGAPIPVAPQDVRTAEVVSPGGVVIAAASPS
jgi:hypothetical protein